MSAVSVEVVREGEAVIRLDGLFEIPASTVFRIEPLDEEGAGGGWPIGDLKPLSARVGEKGVELLIGADVVDAPRLLPGTPVAVSVPAASLRSEMRWPSLQPTKGRRRGAAVVTGEKRAADIAARAEQQRAELARIRAARIEAEREQEAAAQALLESRRMSASEAIAGHVPALKPFHPPAAESRTAENDAEQRGIAAAIDLLPKAEPAAAKATPLGAAVAETQPPPLSAATESDAPTASADADLASKAIAGSSAAAVAAPPPLPAAQATATPPVVENAAPLAAVDDEASMTPAARRSAEEVLSRQVSTRETPVASITRRLQRAFGLGFVAAASLAALATFVLTPGAGPRPTDAALIEQLRAEASGLRERLAGEMEAKRNAETAADTRAIKLEGEIATLRERLVVEARARSGADDASAKLAAAEAEVKRLQAALDADAQRARAGAESLEAANKELGDTRRKLAAAEEARRAAETEAQRLKAEAEQLRIAADSVVKRQAKDAVRAQPAAAVAQPAVTGPAPMDPAMKSPGADKPGAVGPAAKSVTLRVNGSEFEVSGTLESFDGKTFVIMTPNVGAMSFDAARVQCTGSGCPRL